MKTENPFIRQPDDVTPYEHRGKRIASTQDKTPRTVEQLVEAFKIEKDPGLRKLVAMTLLRLLDAEGIDQVADRMSECNLRDPYDKVTLWSLREALEWHIPY